MTRPPTVSSTFRRVYLTIVVYGKKAREVTIAVPISGDVVTDKEVTAGQVSVYCSGVSKAEALPPGTTIETTVPS